MAVAHCVEIGHCQPIDHTNVEASTIKSNNHPNDTIKLQYDWQNLQTLMAFMMMHKNLLEILYNENNTDGGN